MMVHNGMQLLPLPPGDAVQYMIPLNYTLTQVEGVGDGSVMNEGEDCHLLWYGEDGEADQYCQSHGGHKYDQIHSD